jgi:DNA-directed RNA polymerase subunit RPC12/RpoP
MRRVNVTTKMRPFRKLFVIDANDMLAFVRVVREIAGEVDAFRNLILPDDRLLWSATTAELVRRFDPDIIFNLSVLPSERIQDHFEARCVVPDGGRWQIGRFGTGLEYFRSVPRGLIAFGDAFPADVYATDSMTDSPENFFGAVNFGLSEDADPLRFQFTVLENLRIEAVPAVESVVDAMRGERESFWGLCEGVGFGTGNGSSVWEVNHNAGRSFANGRYAFVAAEGDLSSLCYFWNTRAIFGNTAMFWLPSDLLARMDVSNHPFDACVVRDDASAQIASAYFPGIDCLRPDEYRFGSANDRWKLFEHTQDVTVDGPELPVQHPASKTLSEVGASGAFVMELRGVSELAYPVRADSWTLMESLIPGASGFPERFTRISRVGTSQYVLKFAPGEGDVSCTFTIPSLSQWVHHRFEQRGMTIRPTAKTALLEQLDRLVSSSPGREAAKALSTETTHRLVEKMSPAIRSERIEKIVRGASSVDATSRAIEQGIGDGSIGLPTICMSLTQMCDKIGIRKADRMPFFEGVQTLYDHRVLLRGKDIHCPHCKSRIWLPIEAVEARIHCPECGNGIAMPVVEDGDAYKLNRLVTRAFDQGQLATFLLLNFLRAKYRVIDSWSNLEVFEGGTLKTDIDMVLRLGRRVGIAECKSRAGFSEAQISALLDVARAMKSEFVFFSTLLPRDDESIRAVVESLASRDLPFPVFVVTDGVLFGTREAPLAEHFELGRVGFAHAGPILL